MTNFLPLVEKFHSLQGEGFHTGQSAFFIRLAGCNVGCPWCDTKHSWDKEKFPLISIQEIINEIKRARKQGASFLVITGGEPLHHNLDNLCQAINEETSTENQSPIKIHIETSGVSNLSGSFDWITLSPKRHQPPKTYFLKNCNELKIIINDQKDIDFAIDIKQEIMNKYQNSSSTKNFYKLDKKYYLQPAWQNDDGFSLTIDFIKNNPEWNLSLQTHKYLKIK
ncbi:possible organic radical activating enzyme [Prochlorococcus marinus str. MIT 9515]|uniref:7-carboxy-7-deazaguanine synthase n=1 Tax=Prochlorococcus marinus (strain MIT 9515) TaxID=167542 RepID=A2BZ77_PROM5|nr:7-carboxy-7-deazaguanine synthase QueE [Prochlorococcus marinus]ABM73088.1 possible organic radical activating enzyme [Prochlorococcus marinus str. MIT 9515]